MGDGEDRLVVHPVEHPKVGLQVDRDDLYPLASPPSRTRWASQETSVHAGTHEQALASPSDVCICG